MNIVKQKILGKTIYRIRDNKGKHIEYIGTAEKALALIRLAKKSKAQLKLESEQNEPKTTQ